LDRPDSELYRGLRLTQALQWRDRSAPNLGVTEQAFLDAGQALSDAEEHAREYQARRQVRINRRLRVLLAGVAVLLAASLVAGLTAWRQAERADDAAAAADARRLAALIPDVPDDDQALLLAVEAARLGASPATRASLLAALSRNPALVASTHREEPLAIGRLAGSIAPFTVGLDVSPDRRRLAVGGRETTLYDLDTLSRIATWDVGTNTLAFRPDGRQLAAAVNLSTARVVRLLDPNTLEETAVRLGGLPDGRSAVSFDLDYSADGRFLAASVGCCDIDGIESTLVWDLAAPERPFRVDEDLASALSPDGRRLYVLSHSPALSRGVATVYDTATGQLLDSTTFPLDPKWVGDDSSDLMELSPDGTRLAVADLQGIVVFDTATLSVQRHLDELAEQIGTIEFSYDGTVLATGTEDGTVVLLDVVAGTRGEELHGDAGPMRSLAFGPDDTTLYSASDALLAWDVRGDRRLLRPVAPAVLGGSISQRAVPAPDGKAVAYVDSAGRGGGGDTVQFRDVTTGELGGRISSGDSNSGVDWRPADGGQFATAGADGFLRVWDWRTGELIAERRVADGPVGGIAYTHDGRRIVVAERSGAVFQVDAETLGPVGDRVVLDREVEDVFTAPDGRSALVLLTGEAYASIDLVAGSVIHRADLGVDPKWLDVSPDGTHLAVGATTGEVGVIDLGSGEWVRPPVEGHGGWVQRVAYAPDGITIASSGNDGQVTLWDGRTGEELPTLVPGDSNVWTAVEFQPDGHTLLIAGRDGAVATFDTRLDSWIDRACAAAGRNLTDDEWVDAMGERSYRDTCPVHAE